MYLNVSTEAMSITPFEVGYEMAALTLYNKRVPLGILNLDLRWFHIIIKLFIHQKILLAKFTSFCDIY